MFRNAVDQIARETLAIDCGCAVDLFSTGGVTIVQSHSLASQKNQPAIALIIAAYGDSVVVACSAMHFEWAKENLSSLRQTQLFSTACISELSNRIGLKHPGWELGGPHLRFLCGNDTLVPEPRVSQVEVQLLSPLEFATLYARRDELPNALSDPGSRNKDRLLAAAYSGDTLLAAAGATEHSARLWEIGVDTLADSRQRGLARLVVWHLTARMLRDGVAPFYSTLIAKMISQRVARSVGYWPAWIQMVARPISRLSTIQRR